MYCRHVLLRRFRERQAFFAGFPRDRLVPGRDQAVFCLSGVIRLPGPVRLLFPARRPRGFLVQGCRHRSPAWNRPRRFVRRRFDILPGFRRRLGLFRREKPRRRSGIRRRPSGDCRRWGSSLRRNRFPKRNIGRGFRFRIRCGKTAGRPAAGWKP